jgi:8-oxo-dGTP pyrophosphatase MutT (NUDIX family)
MNEQQSANTGKTHAAGRSHLERSAGGVVVRWIGGAPHVLLIKDPYQNWGLPKGHLENGEDTRQAAVREVAEETGLSVLEIGPELGTIEWYFRRKSRLVHKVCTFFLMRSSEGDPVPEVAEGITEVAWLPFGEAKTLIAYANAREMLTNVETILEKGALDPS